MLDVKRIAKRTIVFVPAAVILAFVVIEVRHLTHQVTITNLDYFPLVDRAMRLSFSSWDGWVSWQHPVGFSWLVRLGIELGYDAARFGQAMSVLGGVLGLVGVFLIALAVTNNVRFAIASQVFTAISGYYLSYGGYEGNDMLPAGLQILSVGALAYGLARSPDGAAPRVRWVVLAGVAVGLAYLTRYTGMVTAGVSALVLGGIVMRHRSHATWKAFAIYLTVVVAVTALQWIPSLAVTGSPLSNDQGQGVWFHVYDKTDFLTEWTQAPPDITIGQVFAMNPGRFLRHWWRNFQGFWLTQEVALLGMPLAVFAQAGFIYLLVKGISIRPAIRAVLGLFVVLMLVALSLMRLDPRFLVVVLPILIVGALYLVFDIVPPHGSIHGFHAPIRLLVLFVGLLLAAPVAIAYASDQPMPPPAMIETNNLLRAAGMREAQEVISTDLNLQDLASLSRTRFPQAYWVAPGQKALEELIRTVQAKGFRFLIYDAVAGPKVYPDLVSLLTPESRPAGLTPIYIEPDRKFVIYRIEDAGVAPAQPMGHLEQGISLLKHEISTRRSISDALSWEMGVYLHWRIERPVETPFKVFVHVYDENGQLVAQDDSVPVIWTYPMSQWQAGETVVDFHRVHLRNADLNPTYTMAVGIYDEVTGKRLGWTDSEGHVIAESLILEPVRLSSD